MADTLDDFFAKKDKKKGTKKIKPFSQEKSATPQSNDSQGSTGGLPATNIRTTILKDDDGWIQPEEKVIDYSGLRIQDLSVADTPEPENEDIENSQQQSTGKKSWGTTAKTAEPSSSIAFPSLQHATQDVGQPTPPGMKNFKTVKNGYKGDGPSRHGDQVSLQNRYSAFD